MCFIQIITRTICVPYPRIETVFLGADNEY